MRAKVPVMARPGSLDELAYEPVTQLSELVRTRKVKPSELTDMYLSRLKRYDPQLHFVINLTEERARKQASILDAEIAAGPLPRSAARHPVGREGPARRARLPDDLGRGAVQGPDVRRDATVVKRLDEAGAVLVAKLTLGELAQGRRLVRRR